ncbi:MAG: exodeoxyribonuclease VII large subunit [Bacteroidales bacterium]|nr:exodeoxyribonuclease VII large subunit [Bacteroidales bacterium]
MEKEIVSLFDLQSRLKTGIEGLFPYRVWLRAEISALKARPGGHCYLELSQSDESGLVAKAQAVIWSSRYRFIAPYFESVTGTSLTEGMSVLVCAQVTYSQLYGFSLSISDIDPEFSLGEKERVRQQTIQRLKEEGLTDMQRTLEAPALPRRFAVISAEDAAGYRDFMRHLHENQYGFTFDTVLFPALMQGADSPGSIVDALDRIASADAGFDMVLILRGGGSRLDLACYDDYVLCSHVAQFPIPVFTAIGHDQDYHVCDMVAFSFLKTPTALADEIVGWYADEDAGLLDYVSRLRLAFTGKINNMENRINLLESRIKGADPRNILSRGYVLALDGKGVAMKTAAGRKSGDRVSVMFSDGQLECVVEAVLPAGQPG